MKQYSLEPREDGTIAEIEKYVMTKDAVEITLDAPKNIDDYNSVVVEAEFENPDTPVLEACLREQQDIVLNEPVFDWTCHALDHQYLNDFQKYLGGNWKSIFDKELGLTLLQKTKDDEAGKAGKQYKSVQEFLENPPKKNVTKAIKIDDFGNPIIKEKAVPQIATLDYILPQKYNFQKNLAPKKQKNEVPIMKVGVPVGYEKEQNILESNVTRIPYSLRGDATISVLTDSDLEIYFDKQDLNIYKGEDIYEIKISDQNGIIFYDILSDDGDTENDRMTNIQSYMQKIEAPKEKQPTMYTIQFRYIGDGSDAVIRNLFLNTKYVQMNGIHIADRDNDVAKNIITKPITLYSLSGEISAKAAHDYSEQNILVNDESKKISFLEATQISLEKPINEIYIAKNDLLISSEENGFAMTPEGIFETAPYATIPFDIAKMSNISYILTPYKKGRVKLAWKKHENDKNDGKKLLLRLSAKSLEGYRSSIRIDSLKITLRKEDVPFENEF